MLEKKGKDERENKYNLKDYCSKKQNNIQCTFKAHPWFLNNLEVLNWHSGTLDLTQSCLECFDFWQHSDTCSNSSEKKRKGIRSF